MPEQLLLATWAGSQCAGKTNFGSERGQSARRDDYADASGVSDGKYGSEPGGAAAGVPQGL